MSGAPRRQALDVELFEQPFRHFGKPGPGDDRAGAEGRRAAGTRRRDQSSLIAPCATTVPQRLRSRSKNVTNSGGDIV